MRHLKKVPANLASMDAFMMTLMVPTLWSLQQYFCKNYLMGKIKYTSNKKVLLVTCHPDSPACLQQWYSGTNPGYSVSFPSPHLHLSLMHQSVP